MRYFTKQYHPPGTSPGTLTERVLPETGELRISLIDYSDTDFVEKPLVSVEECKAFLKQPTITWIHIQGQSTEELLKHFAEFYELHPLALEDILNTGQRPKMETFAAQLFVITSLPVMFNGNVVSEQVSMTVITTIFIPLTFIVGVYGMNFSVNENSPWAIPERHWYYGYPLLWLIMITIAVGMIIFFKRKKMVLTAISIRPQVESP